MNSRSMCFYVIALFLSLTFSSCKSDKGSASASEEILVDDEGEVMTTTIEEEEEVSKWLFAKLDRLKIRSDSSMNAKTVTVVSENDSLLYLDAFSSKRENLRLRKKYYYEPWLKVKHVKSGKLGWVYGGAVIYESSRLADKISKSSPLVQQVYADDLEWDGTVPSGWATASITDPVEFKMFLIRFKGMVQNDDVDGIAKLVKYPLKEIQGSVDFKANYSRLFTDEVKAVVAEQRLDRIFRNSQGAKLGDGEITFNQVGDDYKIVAVDFKDRSDLTRELMSDLSGQYVTDSPSGKQSIRAFSIRKFLELTLNYQDSRGFPQSKSLGRYLHETSHNGRHGFYQDTNDSTRRQLIFREEDSLRVLTVLNDMSLSDLEFIK